jgi:hypothetical protein
LYLAISNNNYQEVHQPEEEKNTTQARASKGTDAGYDKLFWRAKAIIRKATSNTRQEFPTTERSFMKK